MTSSLSGTDLTAAIAALDAYLDGLPAPAWGDDEDVDDAGCLTLGDLRAIRDALARYAELCERMAGAAKRLLESADKKASIMEDARLRAKSSGVRLAMSYLDEVTR